MKKYVKILLSILILLIILGTVFWLYVYYAFNYKLTTCDSSVSPDGKYELILQAVGEAKFPFGSASGRLVLKEGQKEICQSDFELNDDGGNIRSDNWSVTWHETYVEVILSAEEQYDEQVILRFDGTKESRQLIDSDKHW